MPPTEVTPRFTAAELDRAFAGFQATVAEVAQTHDWDKWADQFTEATDYVEQARGTFKGREAIRAWVNKTMQAFPGIHMTGYPSLWHVTDPSTSRVIFEVDNPMRDPGDGTLITATNITILTYAGAGLWSREEDVYNPLLFGRAAMKWCQKATELGTIDAPAQQWMDTVGKMFDRR